MGAIVNTTPTGSKNIMTTGAQEKGLSMKCPYCGLKVENQGWLNTHIASVHKDKWDETNPGDNPITTAVEKPEEEKQETEIDFEQEFDDIMKYIAEQQKHLEERQDSTAQRTVEDMRKAGLDPRSVQGSFNAGTALQNQEQNLAGEQALKAKELQIQMKQIQQDLQIAIMQNDTARAGQLMQMYQTIINQLTPQLII